MHLGHVFGHGTERRHRPERLSFEIHVETGHNDALAFVGQRAAHRHQPFLEKLGFVDAHHIGLRRSVKDLVDRIEGLRIEGARIVRHHFFVAVTRVDGRFEDHHFLTRNARTLDTANQFFSFAGEHAAAYHFDAAFAWEMFVVGHDGKRVIF